MINTYNAYISDIKGQSQKVKSIINLLIIFSICISIVYFFYWVAVMSDDYILSFTESVFRPLASLFSFGDSSYEIYRRTSLIFLGLIFPLSYSYGIIDKIEEKRIDEYLKKVEEAERKARIIAQYKELKQYDDIKSYSICLSLDYKAKEEIPNSKKIALNKIIYSKIKTALETSSTNIKVSLKDVLIITSKDFMNYDNIYDVTLNLLAKIKSFVDKKYSIETIPSITTDAYIDFKDTDDIEKNHFEIQSFNFKNRALSTALFSKKYTHLKKSKYVGIPIGQYASFDNEKTNTYELNIVYKNLAQTLSKL